MDHSQLQTLFDNGAIKGAEVLPCPMEKNAWIISITMANGHDEVITKHRSRDPRIFRSLDAAKNLAQKIGLRQVMWTLA